MIISFGVIIIFTAISRSSTSEFDADCTKDSFWNCQDDGAVPLNFERHSLIVRDQDNWDEIHHDVDEETIPENFDARIAWPKCKSVISRIKNQGPCSNSWSFCATMVLADRVCIASKGKDKPDFSIHDLSNCCTRCLDVPSASPCKYGGTTFYAFQYAVDEGIAFESCQPLNLTELCSNVPKCGNRCLDRQKHYKRNSHLATLALISESRYNIELDEIQAEILKNGPICSELINLTKEFKLWNQKGIFIPDFQKQRSPRAAPAAHAIRIIGWGTEGGIDYWLCANSWGRSWGDGGFFKIRRGINEFNMEEQFTTVLTKPLSYHPESAAADLLIDEFLGISTIIYFLVYVIPF